MYKNNETLEIVENSISEAYGFIFALNNVDKLGYAKNYVIEVMRDIADEHMESDLGIVCDIISDVQNKMIHS